MKRYKEPDLSILHPLPNAIARALFDARHQRSIVYNAVEDFPGRRGGQRSTAMLRLRARASGSRRMVCLLHIAPMRTSVRIRECAQYGVVVRSAPAGYAHIKVWAGGGRGDIRRWQCLGRFYACTVLGTILLHSRPFMLNLRAQWRQRGNLQRAHALSRTAGSQRQEM